MKKTNHTADQARYLGNAHYSTYHPDYFAAGSVARMAIQHRLGLLSERRLRTDPVDRDNSLCNGETLTPRAVRSVALAALRRQRLFQSVSGFARATARVRMRIILEFVPRNPRVVSERVHRHATTRAAALQMPM